MRESTVPTRISEVRHGRQLSEFGAIGSHTELMSRSCFGFVTVWNILPSSAAEATFKIYQRAKYGMASPESEWQHLFSRDERTMPTAKFQRLFV